MTDALVSRRREVSVAICCWMVSILPFSSGKCEKEEEEEEKGR